MRSRAVIRKRFSNPEEEDKPWKAWASLLVRGTQYNLILHLVKRALDDFENWRSDRRKSTFDGESLKTATFLIRQALQSYRKAAPSSKIELLLNSQDLHGP